MNILRSTALTILLLTFSAQASDYLITWIAPPTKIDTSLCVRIDFMKTGFALDDSFTVYYGTQTGGGIPANYPSRASNVFRIGNTLLSDSAINYKSVNLPDSLKKSYTKADSTSLTMRSIYFAPRHQNMTAGRFYFIVKGNKNGVSQEAQLIVETKEAAPLISPKGNITSMQPVFSWSPVPGVPYYHLLLSDQTIKIDSGSLSNASFIWQAIVPGGEIQYGSLDPSGIFPPPPPLSPGTKYQWLVLNNYGNQKEYTSVNAVPIPADFTIAGSLDGLTPPDTSTMKTKGDTRTLTSLFDSTGKLLSVDTFKVGTNDSGKINLSWGKVTHDDFNLYRIYLYNVVFDSSTNSDAAIAVWTRSTTDTFVTINAKSFLADSVLHVWKVFVENTSGAGVASGKKAFFYNDTTSKATIRYRSYERVGTTDSVIIKFANVTITPLSGGGLPIDIPTNENGYGSKTVQYGSYRVLMNPAGYKEESRDVTVSSTKNDTTLTFVLSPYPAQIFGSVADSGNPVGDATIEAVSATGDTLRVNSDASGSFSLRVDAGDWQLTANKLGYRRSNPESYTLTNGQSRNAGALNISMYTNLISGTVRNLSNNSPIINAIVTLKRNGVVVGEKRSSDVGSYTFAVEAGTGYEVIVERQGFSTASRSNITLTTNVVYDAYLSSSTGSIAGEAFVTTNMITATTSTFVTNGRQGIVITAVDSTGDTVATTESNRGDNTFLLTLVPGTYKLHCNGEGVLPDSFSNVVVLENNTTTQNVTLREFGRILGRVYAKSGGVNGIVDVTARHSSGAVMNTQTAQSTGDYSLTGLIPGSWSLTFAKNGFVSKTASRTIVDTTLSASVKAVTSRYIALDSLSQGTLTISFTMSILDSAIASDSLQSVRVVSPSPMNVPFGTSLSQAGAGSYVFGTSLTDKQVLSIDSLGKTVSANSSVALAHPFWHVNKNIADTSRDSVTLKLFIKGTTYSVIETSAKLFYRDQSSNTWNSVIRKQKSNDTLIFKLLPTSDNSNMVYYFEVKASAGSETVKWSNRLSTYSTFIPARSGIKYMMLFPSAWDAATPASIPWKTSTEFTVLCQDGAFKLANPDSVLWIPRTRNGIITFKDLKSRTMTATVTGDTLINEATVDTVLCKVYFAGRDTTIKTYYRIAKQKIDMLVISSSAKSIGSGQKASFLVAGVNLETGRVFPAMGSWATLSSFNYPYGISSMGEFTAPPNYIGTVKIRAEAFGKRAFFDLPVRHQIKAGDTSFAFDASTASDAGIILGFGSTVYPIGTGRDLYLLATPPTELPVLKAITSLGEVISSTYLLTLGNASSELPSSVFTVMIKIPETFRDKQVFPAVWDQKTTAWIAIDTHKVTYLDAANRFLSKVEAKKAPSGAVYARLSIQSFGIISGNGVSGEYALLNASDEFGIKELKIGPSPFSPLVNAVDSIGNKWQGLRIEFFVSSDASAQSYSEVQILNMEGSVINSKLMSHEETVSGFNELYSLNTKGGFFGRRTLKRVYLWNGTNNSGRMCRNGRYLVRIRATDGAKTQYKTIPVTLFK